MTNNTNQQHKKFLSTVLFDKKKTIVQSYLWSTAQYNMNKLEKRIMYKIIESIHDGNIIKIEDLIKCNKIETGGFYNKIFTIPIKEIFINEGNTNYSYIKELLEKMKSKNITIEKNKNIEGVIDAVIQNRRGLLEFSIKKDIFDVLVDFSKGWRRFQLNLAMSLSSVYSMRMYEIIASKEQPHTYIFNLEKFKSILYLQNKYSRTFDFKDKILDTAKKELDAKATISFDYSIKRDIITIVSYRVEKNKQNTLSNQERSEKKMRSFNRPPQKTLYKLNDIGFYNKEIVLNIPIDNVKKIYINLTT